MTERRFVGGPSDGKLFTPVDGVKWVEKPAVNPDYDPLENGITWDEWGLPLDGKGNRPIRRARYRNTDDGLIFEGYDP